MTGKTWAKTKGKARKAIKKVAVDLLKLYAQRSQMQGFTYPTDMPWQQELEDSFPYQPTPDQLKATQECEKGYGKRSPYGSSRLRRRRLRQNRSRPPRHLQSRYRRQASRPTRPHPLSSPSSTTTPSKNASPPTPSSSGSSTASAPPANAKPFCSG